MNTDKLKQLARDLRKTPPHSPRDTLGGFVIAARMLDKARAFCSASMASTTSIHVA
jgi:hypothetical protein